LNQLPINGLGENELKIGIGSWFAGFGTGQALRIDVLEPRHELEAQQMAESKGHLVLPMGIDKLLFNRHLGTMPQHAFDHRCHFRR